MPVIQWQKTTVLTWRKLTNYYFMLLRACTFFHVWSYRRTPTLQLLWRRCRLKQIIKTHYIIHAFVSHNDETSGQRILTTGRVARSRIFHMGKVNVNTVQLGAMQSAAAVALMPLLIFFYRVHRSSDSNAIQWDGQSLKIDPSLGAYWPHLIQTDRQTDALTRRQTTLLLL